MQVKFSLIQNDGDIVKKSNVTFWTKAHTLPTVGLGLNCYD